MKYTEQQIRDIFSLNRLGIAGVDIAFAVNASKSGVNEFLAKHREDKLKGPNIVFLDIETSAAKVYAFGRHKQFINQDAVIEEGGNILMAGVSSIKSNQVLLLSCTPNEAKSGEDFNVCQVIRESLEDADAIVAHNGKNFDIKMLENRFSFHGIRPLRKVPILDTLEMAKKAYRLPSNKLDSIAAYFDIGRKIDTGGIDLWVRVQSGDKKALEEMQEYCKHDVELLKRVFLELRARGITAGFNAGLYYQDHNHRCKVCGSSATTLTGKIATTPAGVYHETECLECGAFSRTKDNILSKDKRSTLLS